MLKKPDGIRLLAKKNFIRPFEDPSSIEFLAERNDASLFMETSHNKKRFEKLNLICIYFFFFLKAS